MRYLRNLDFGKSQDIPSVITMRTQQETGCAAPDLKVEYACTFVEDVAIGGGPAKR